MPFLDSRLSVIQQDDKRWTLAHPLMFKTGDMFFFVPVHYVTDFASVPRVVWWLVPRYGKYTAATVLHDWLITDLLPTGHISSREVDRVFRTAMKDLGVSFARRWLMWAGVRWGAVFNPKRRAGVWRDLPLVFLVSALSLPFVLPALALIPSLLVFTALDRVT